MGSSSSGRRGWGNYEDLSGQRFGRWTVIKRVEDNHWCQMQFQCRCDCGWEASVQARVLKSGRSKSCGCLKSEILSKEMKRKWEDGTFKHEQRIKPRKRKNDYME